MAAGWWITRISNGPRCYPLTPPLLMSMPSAADAWASQSASGIGGWFSLSPNPTLASVYWFHLDIDLSLFPDTWHLDLPDQRYISCLELFAQIALVYVSSHILGGFATHIMLPQDTDNTPTDAVAYKLYSSKVPMCYFTQLLAWWCVHLRITPLVSWRSGISNEWADKLSRWDDPQFITQLTPSLQVSVTIPDLIAPFTRALDVVNQQVSSRSMAASTAAREGR